MSVTSICPPSQVMCIAHGSSIVRLWMVLETEQWMDLFYGIRLWLSILHTHVYNVHTRTCMYMYTCTCMYMYTCMHTYTARGLSAQLHSEGWAGWSSCSSGHHLSCPLPQWSCSLLHLWQEHNNRHVCPAGSEQGQYDQCFFKYNIQYSYRCGFVTLWC